jgi:prepilin-type N-terminal cleavage/methylation domain-containing protein
MRVAVTISVAGMAARRGTSGGARGSRAGFTLVELLVTMVIIAILAALTLAGLAGVRQGAKADKTRNTIRKIDAVIRPLSDSYRNRRVTTTTGGAASRNYAQLLLDKRKLMVYEMPDQWADVPGSLSGVPAQFQTAAVRAYVGGRGSPSDPFGSAECLYMIVERSGCDPDALEFFRPDEIGDVDGDTKPEFLDGWGRPIAFLRWAPGFSSPIQSSEQLNNVPKYPDPIDPARKDPTAYALVPLIYSAGPDGALGTATDDVPGYGLQTSKSVLGSTGWLGINLNPLCTGVAATVGSALAGNEALDNITNHDLTKK